MHNRYGGRVQEFELREVKLWKVSLNYVSPPLSCMLSREKGYPTGELLPHTARGDGQGCHTLFVPLNHPKTRAGRDSPAPAGSAAPAPAVLLLSKAPAMLRDGCAIHLPLVKPPWAPERSSFFVQQWISQPTLSCCPGMCPSSGSVFSLCGHNCLPMFCGDT